MNTFFIIFEEPIQSNSNRLAQIMCAFSRSEFKMSPKWITFVLKWTYPNISQKCKRTFLRTYSLKIILHLSPLFMQYFANFVRNYWRFRSAYLIFPSNSSVVFYYLHLSYNSSMMILKQKCFTSNNLDQGYSWIVRLVCSEWIKNIKLKSKLFMIAQFIGFTHGKTLCTEPYRLNHL